ncbi:sensor histidine kinase [Vagococcus vulneris]|uniref:histidine kinase n=1 Tax=Vagococcus vulneris TaxID=1977869 RepID=A0A429ZZD4_9ENTE|nr:HAMP domain-containing sensor histidine kinase [Vagococcus vulneris]RST99368.1 hypothetical protein CBF37_05200 [Vagococcus vulneris]
MAVKKSKSLTYYMGRLFFIQFCGFLLIIGVAILIFSGLIFKGIVSPADAGEREATQWLNYIDQEQQIPNQLTTNYTDFAIYNAQGDIKRSTIDSSVFEKLVLRAKKSEGNYQSSTASLSNGDKIIFIWKYRAMLTNRTFRRLIPNFEIFYLSIILVLLFAYFILFVKRASLLINKKITQISQATQQISQKNLTSKIIADTGINEFDEALNSMEDLRESLRESLTNQWSDFQQYERNVSAMLHDIKTPLTVITGNTELILEETTDRDIEELAESVYMSGYKLQQYTEKMRDLSIISKDNQKTTVIQCDQLINDVFQLLKAAAEKNNNRLIYKKNTTIKEIKADELMLSRALINIGDNAIRYAMFGTDITFSVFQNNQQTTFEVEDVGPSFSEEALKHAATFLWQEEKSRQSSEHAGIGLTMVKETARTHGGQLMLKNTETGVTVSFSVLNKPII